MTKSLLLQILSLLVEAVLKQLLLKSHLIIRMTVMMIIRMTVIMIIRMTVIMIIRMSGLTRTVDPYQLLVPFLFNLLNWLNVFFFNSTFDWANLWTFNGRLDNIGKFPFLCKAEFAHQFLFM